MTEGTMAAHARLRVAQRNLSPEQVDYVLEHGVEVQRTGVTFYVLRERDVPPTHRRNDRYAKLAGTVLLVARGGTLVTAYRHRNAPHHVGKKCKYRL